MLQLTWGAIGLLLGVVDMGCSPSARGRRWRTSPATGIAAGVTAVAFAISRLALLLAGRPTPGPAGRFGASEALGRTAMLGLAVPNLFVLPFGTALGIYALWVLLHNEARSMFIAARST